MSFIMGSRSKQILSLLKQNSTETKNVPPPVSDSMLLEALNNDIIFSNSDTILPNQVNISFEDPNTSEFNPTASTISSDLVTDPEIHSKQSSSYPPNNCALNDRNIPEEESDSVYEILTPLHNNTDRSDYNENSASNENSFQSSTRNDDSEATEQLTKKKNKKLQNKKNKSRGKEYVNCHGAVQSKKEIKPNPCKGKQCNNKCKTFTEEERQVFFENFYNLGDDKKQKISLSECIHTIRVKRRRTLKETSKRVFTHEYYLLRENNKERVCQQFLLATLAISQRCLRTVIANKDGLPLEGGTMTVSPDGNTTTSTLSFTPTSSDHGLTLSCRASNQMVPHSEMRDTWMLRVLYPPKVTLTLGHGLNANDIKEGADVYFECHLVANPWVLRVWWLQDGNRLLSNSTAGLIVSNQTLVLQGVTRTSSGRYFCEAGNSEGTTRSAPFQLRVKFEPVCGEGGGRKILGAAKGEPLRIECKVDAEPAASLFRWIFNSTPGVSRELSEFTAEPGSSVLTYTPSIAAHYGTLQCWGRNELGSQQTPCVYHIVPAGRPDPPNGCAVSNITHHSVTVNCKKGFDGGLRQKFVLLISAAENLTANLSSSVPEFQISNLDATTEYIATAHSINAKGWSKASNSILIKTLPSPGLKELRRSTGPSNEEKVEGPWLYILLAAGSTLIVAGAIGVIIFAVKRIKVESPVRERRSRSPKRDELPLNPQVSAYTDTINDDKNPDLIPPPDYVSLCSRKPSFRSNDCSSLHDNRQAIDEKELRYSNASQALSRNMGSNAAVSQLLHSNTSSAQREFCLTPPAVSVSGPIPPVIFVNISYF
ncbi:hypothetical protein RI129_003176 [Pyrocoelia pectoralis]|uniref:Nephrin n=1 Tax=Pyrocoelia pectoralis TaxID=417401 RepID=A0AAN7VQK1_9COLE